ncbi:uncharacterized protein LOC134712004 [Mytilus trossulus]|uniref:uncharacterized protein LOC134712004 n=1 Tax=Mytilus trossulus TaxID=6551 RepID=UPI00300698CA
MTDQENYYRFSSIIVDHGKEALVILLDNDLSNQNLSFENFLNKHQHEIYHLHYVDKKLRCCQCPSGFSSQAGPQRVLYAYQLDILLDKHGQKLPCHYLSSTRPYCCSLAKPGVTTKELDITLARCLLVNFSTICPPGSPIRRAVDTIVDCRNKLGHAREAKMPASDFQKDVADIELAILTIAQVCNVENDMKQKLHDVKNRSLDQTLCIQYQNRLLQEMNQKGEMVESISTIKEQLQTNLQETTSMFSDIRITQLETKERTEVLENQVDDVNRRIQEDMKEINRKVDTTKNVIYEDTKADMQEAVVQVKTRIDSLERHLDEQHNKLHTHVDKIELNAVKSSTDIRTVLQKNMDDYETRLHHHIDDTVLQLAKRTPADQRKQNIIAQTNSLLTSHRANECYIVPKAVQAGQTLFNKHNIAIIVSKGGEGKTTTALQLATIYKDLGYIPYWFVDQDIKLFRDIIDPNDKCIIVIDDLFGRRFTEFDENIHRNILDILYAIVSNSHEMKLVFTITSDSNCLQNIITEHAILKDGIILDLDRTFKLSLVEKKSIFYKYMETSKIVTCSCHETMSFTQFYESNLREQTYCDNDVEELPNKTIQICTSAITRIVEMYLPTGFSETCRMFCSNPSFTLLGTRYFENPNQSLIDKIDELYVEGHENKIVRYQYCLLLYTALKGPIELDVIENSLVHNAFFIELFSIFDDNSLKIKKILILEAVKKLKGKFLEENTIYDSGKIRDGLTFKHQSISDAVLLSYGKENTSQVLGNNDLKFIYTYVRPNTSISKNPSKTLYVPDDVICYRFKQILEMEQKSDYYLDIATDVGKYIRRIEIDEMNKGFMKTFIELVPISWLESYQVKELFNALTQFGKHCEIIHPYLDKCAIDIWKHGSIELIYSICRPQSTIVDPMKFVLLSDESMVKKLLNVIISHDTENITPLVGVGEYLYTLSREKNHIFVNLFLSRISMKWDDTYEARLIIDGFTKEGGRKELIPIYRTILSHFIPFNCSINVIFKFCRASMSRENCNDQVLLVDRRTLIYQLKMAFDKCLSGVQLDYYCCTSLETQVEEIGRNCYSFLAAVKDKSFLDEIVDAFVTVIQQKFSVETPINQSLNFYCYFSMASFLYNKDPKFTLSFFDGLTSFGEHLQPLKEKFPNLIENLERHTSRYRYIKKVASAMEQEYFDDEYSNLKS